MGKGRGVWGMLAGLAIALVLCGCGPDRRISGSIDVIKQAQEMQARNADKTWAAFIAQYREKEMATINGFYLADVKKADAQKPKRENFMTVEQWAEDLVRYTGERTTYLDGSERVRKRNIEKLDAKIATANATYEATKKNRESYNKLLTLLKEYEEAKIDPVAAAPLFLQIVSTFIPVDKPPESPKVVKPKGPPTL